MKSGFVAIIGKPNAGKSTILNSILERDVSIVTDKAQTTRNAIRGIYDDDEYQIVFVDTPGIHKARHSLGKIMNQDAFDSTKGVDAIILVVDASLKFTEADEFIIRSLPKDVATIVAINKIDLIKLPQAEAIKQTYKNNIPDAKIIELSAIKGFGIEDILNAVKPLMSEGPRYYPKDTISDKDSSFYVSEVVREKLLLLLREEVLICILFQNTCWFLHYLSFYFRIFYIWIMAFILSYL